MIQEKAILLINLATTPHILNNNNYSKVYSLDFTVINLIAMRNRALIQKVSYLLTYLVKSAEDITDLNKTPTPCP
jgi:hypothetical protein